MKRLKCTWRRITVCAMSTVLFLAAGCTNKNKNIVSVSCLGHGGTAKHVTQHVDYYAYAKEVGRSAAKLNVSKKVSIMYDRRYNNIQKGSYSGITYQVKWSDTLFYIAWITGNDYLELAKKNNILPPYSLSLGQILQVGIGKGTTNSPAAFSSAKTPNGATPTAALSQITATGWCWPTDGKIIEHFSFAEGGNKGVDISGFRGQPILATASGRVVYAGHALRGYGNLIIIKHNDNYLSAYAHNDTIIVHEQQEVKAGQKIATMGRTGTSTTRLHFEMHYKGKSVNPLRYLPARAN